MNPLRKCGFDVESISHFFFQCPVYNNDRSSRLSTIRNNDCKLLENTDTSLTQTLLYGNSSLDINTNSPILNATINFILSAKGFEEAFI